MPLVDYMIEARFAFARNKKQQINKKGKKHIFLLFLDEPAIIPISKAPDL